MKVYFCRGMRFAQGKTHLHTWQIEACIVAGVLLVTAFISQNGLIEFVGVGAVFFSWMHASVANSLEEAQRAKMKNDSLVEVHCYYWLPRYFYIKELLWCFYFFALGAWSALVGVFIFLFYQYWRRVWSEYEQTVLGRHSNNS